jgi:hypothetical protein
MLSRNQALKMKRNEKRKRISVEVNILEPRISYFFTLSHMGPLEDVEINIQRL